MSRKLLNYKEKVKKYKEYGKTLERASRQCGKSTIVMLQMLNWLQYSDCPEKFEPLHFGMELVDVRDL